MSKLFGFAGAETEGLEELSTTHSSLSADTTIKRTTGGAASFKNTAVAATSLNIYTPPISITQPSSAGQEYIVGFGFRIDGTNIAAEDWNFFGIGDGVGANDTITLGIRTDASGNMSLYAYPDDIADKVAGTTTLSQDTWYYIEVHFSCHGTTGFVDVYVDGAVEVEITGADTVNHQPNMVSWYSLNSGTVDYDAYWIDDIYIMGDVRNATDRLGPVEIYGHVCDETTSVPDFHGDVVVSGAGSTLSSGTWDNTATLTETDLAEYTSSVSQSGADGIPLDSGITSTHTVHASIGLFRCKRSGGGGTPKNFVTGRTAVDATPSNTDRHLAHTPPAALTTAFTDYHLLSTQGDPLVLASTPTTNPSAATDDYRCAAELDGRIVLGDLQGNIIYSDDGGDTWTAATGDSLFTGAIYGVVANEADGIFIAVGAGAKIGISTDGNTWTAPTTNPLTTSDLRRVVYDPVHDHYVACSNQASNEAIIYSDDQGDTWTKMTGGLTGNSYSLCFNPGSNNLIVGTSTNTYRSYDGGVTWTDSTTRGISGTAWSLAANDAGRCIIGGANGELFYSTDGGNTWAECTSSGDDASTFWDIIWTGDYFLALAGATVYISRDGDTFTDVDSFFNITSPFTSVYDKSTGTLVVAGNNKDIDLSGIAAMPDPSSTDVVLLGIRKDTGGQDMDLAWAINMLLTTPATGTTYNESVTLAKSLSLTAAQDSALGAAVTLGLSLEHAASVIWNVNASASMDHALEHAASYTYDAEAAVTLGIEHNIGHQLFTDWDMDDANSWGITNGAWTHGGTYFDGTGATGMLYHLEIEPAVVGRSYMYAFEISAYSSGLVSALAGSSTTGTHAGNGIKTGTITCATLGDGRLGLYGLSANCNVLWAKMWPIGGVYTEWSTSASASLDHSLAISVVGELEAVIHEAAVTLGVDLSQAQAAEIAYQVAVTLSKSLEQSSVGENDTSSSVSLGVSLEHSALAGWITDAAANLGISLSQDQASEISLEVAVTLSHVLEQSIASEWNTDASTSLGHVLAQTVVGEWNTSAAASLGLSLEHASNAGWSTDSATSMDHSLAQSQVAGWVTDGLASLDHSLTHSATAQNVIGAVVELALSLDQAQVSEFSAQTFEAAVTMAIELAETGAASIGHAAQIALNHALEMAGSAQVDFDGQVSIDHALEVNRVGQSDFVGAVTLSHDLGLGIAEQKIISVAVSMALELGASTTAAQIIESVLTMAVDLGLSSSSAGSVFEAALTLPITQDLFPSYSNDLFATVALSHSLTQTGAPTWNIGANVGLDHSLGEDNAATQVLESDVSLDHVLGEDNTVTQTVESFLTLALELTQAGSAGRVTDAVTSFAHALGQNGANTVDLSGAVLLAHQLAQTPDASVDWDAYSTFDHSLGQSPLAGWITDASVSLDISLLQSEIGQNVTAAVLDLAYDLSLTTTSDISTQNIFAAVTLGVELAQDPAVNAEYAAQLSLGHVLLAAETVDWVAYAAVAMDHSLAANSAGNVVKDAVLTLATSLGLDAEAVNVVEGAVTLAVELSEAADVSVEYAAQLALGHMLYTFEAGQNDALAALTLTHALDYQTTATLWSAVFEPSALRTTTPAFEPRTITPAVEDRTITTATDPRISL